ncbi:MAG TPA: hypothetical protein VLC07_02010 [Solirubrobacterales bacterium]|nr:hypothetical protein [Solirubrobacterales bacterium]
MADQNPKGLEPPKFLTTYDEDERDQLAVLRQVLFLHPASLTRTELTRELSGAGLQRDPTPDAMERAVRELAGTGLLHPPFGDDKPVLPTRAAVRYYELSGGA